jgi:type IV pilus assembly protein PilX
MQRESTSGGGERGAVLVVSLVFLLVMTLLGITALSTNSLEEHIAGNLRDQDVAFQASESAVRACEGYVLNNNLAGQFVSTCANGLCVPAAPPPATQVWKNAGLNVWSGTTKSQRIPQNLAHVASQPRYIVEDVTTAFGCLPGETCVVGFGANSVSLYRCTGRGIGGTATAVVLSQSVYKKF